MRDSFEALSQRDLAVLVPELLLCGQLIDRSGMAHLIVEFGREGMAQVAVEEWESASPWYTRRMQKALGYEGDDVVTIFKGLQLDIGAPPQFMDFRYRVDDPLHGEFWLDHCGALMDVEPLGDEFVTSMCHDIEDPTFDATAIATNPRAQIRPIHRPPRRPADRHPHCAWTVSIDPSHTPPVMTAHTERIGRTAAVTVELSPIDHGGDGRADYSGPLLSDLRFSDFSRSALVRIAEEICVQHHLLALGFLAAVRRRADEDKARGHHAKAIDRNRGSCGTAYSRCARASFDAGIVGIGPVRASLAESEAVCGERVSTGRRCSGAADLARSSCRPRRRLADLARQRAP